MGRPIGVLEQARRDAGLSLTELWFRYFELGGMSTSFELDAVLHDSLVPSPHERDVIAVALNERFDELGGDHPVPYIGDS